MTFTIVFMTFTIVFMTFTIVFIIFIVFFSEPLIVPMLPMTAKKKKEKEGKKKKRDTELEKSILNLNRQFLHAKILGFDHPHTGQRLVYSSKLPDDLETILKKLRNTSK